MTMNVRLHFRLFDNFWEGIFRQFARANIWLFWHRIIQQRFWNFIQEIYSKDLNQRVFLFFTFFAFFILFSMFVLGISCLYWFTKYFWFFCPYWFTNRAIFFFQRRKDKKKLLPCLSTGVFCHCIEEFKVGVIFDWLKLLQESSE
jgi:hypothetical protein